MKNQLLFLLMPLFMFSCTDKKQTNILYPTHEFAKAGDYTLEELFDAPQESIQLETSDNCLLGEIWKLVELEGSYYALSNGQIYHFDAKGKHQSTLNRKGNGPGEYTQLSDYDLFVNSKGEVELWVCDVKEIMRYVLKDNKEWRYTGELSFDYMIHKFCRASDNDILLMAGRNEQILQHVDTLGNVKNSYLEKSIPFLTFKSVQFLSYNQQIIFPLGLSNGYASLDIKTGSFMQGDFFDDSSLLSPKELNGLFESFDYDYFREISNYKYVRNIRQASDVVLVDYVDGKNRYLTVMQNDGKRKSVQLSPTSTLKDKQYTNFLMTLGVSYSYSDYILFFGVFDNSENNPCILKYDFK